MGQAVRERTEEIGVLKAMGFTNELVLGLVMLESCLIAVLGGLTGLGLAWLLLSFGSPIPSVMPILYLPLRDVLWGALFVLLLGVIAGAFPAIQAMRLRIAEALRRGA
jgi:putative ABC transport system permease protein